MSKLPMRQLALALTNVLGLGVASPSFATTTTSAAIIAATINPTTLRCLDHCIIGVCIWLRPILVPPFYRVETTLRVRHKFPDVVVSVFEHPGDNPWIEVRPLSNLAAQAAQTLYGALSQTTVRGGRHTPAANQIEGQNDPSHDVRREQIRFGEAEIYGHPLASVIGQSPIGFGVNIPGICPIETRSFFPYYQSGFDALSWRNPEVELLYPGTWIPFYREVRNSTFTSIWGSVFPRNGILAAQSDPYKAAAVFAQRAADIVTNSYQPHVYIPVPGSAANETTDLWQQIAPYPELSCGPFGSSGPLISPATIALDDDKVWQLWRPYECCLPNNGAVHVSTVTTPAVCLL